MQSPFERRTRECQDALRSTVADGLVLFPGANLYYLTGVDEEPSERHFLLVVAPDGDPTLVVPELSGDQVAESTWIDDLRTYSDEDDPRAVLEGAIDDLAVDGHVLVDDHLWATFYRDLQSVLPGATFGLASEVLADLRMRKDDRELAALRSVADLTDEVSEAVRGLGADAVGTTERELAWTIERRMRDAGGGEPSFDVIVGSGPNGAMPHHTHGDRRIERGDPVVLDFGCYRDRYPSDQTRTVVFAGDPPGEFEAAHEAVREAQAAAVDAVEPGVTAGSVDRAARSVVEDHGFGDAFIHRTGHGVGLDVHEPPYIVEGNDRILEEGMVFSVEPGVYLDGFGVRIEDLVAVTADGCERLNDSSRDWRPPRTDTYSR